MKTYLEKLLRRRIVSGTIANLITQIIHFASRIILPPLFIYSWGLDIYGEWILLTSFIAYLSLTDIGGQIYVINKLCEHWTKDEYKEFAKTFRSGILFFTLIPSIVFTIAIIILSTNINLDFTNIPKFDLQIVILSLVFQFCLSMPLGLLLGVYRATGNYFKGIMYSNAIAILQLIISSGLLYFGADIIILSLAQLIPYILIGSIVSINLYINNKHLDIRLISLKDLNNIRTIISPSFSVFLIQLSQMLSMQGVVIALGLTVSKGELVLYTLSRTIVFSAQQISSLFSHPAWPEYTKYYHLKNYNKLKEIFTKIFSLSITVAILIAILIFVLGPSIMNLWIGNKISYNMQLMTALSFYMVLKLVWSLSADFIIAINKQYLIANKIFVTSILCVLLSYFFGKQYGIVVAVYGQIISEILVLLWYCPYIAYKSIKNEN